MAERKPLVLIDGAIQQLQDGDTVAGATTTATAPEITNPDGTTLFTSINENETKTCRIKDYDPSVHYILSANKGAIGSINSDGTFSYTAPDITDGNNTTDNIFIYYTIGTIVSATKQYNLNIIYVPIEADGVLSNTDFVANESSSTNLTVDTNTLTATTDSAVYIEKPVEQESEDTDWAEIKDTTIYYKPNEITVLSDTTATELSTFTEVAQSQPVILIKQDNTAITGNLWNVTETSLIDNVDPFGDSNGTALWQFDGNANDTGGNYKGTWSGTEQYDTGKWGQAAKFDGNSQINCGRINTSLDELWVSFWMYWNGVYNEMPIGFYKYNIYISPDGYFAWNTNNSDRYGIDFPTSEYANKWLHIVVNFKTGDYGDTMYINGIKQNLSQKKRTIISSNAVIKNVDLHISGWSYDNNYKFKGLIDQVRIFNRALTAEEVAILYNEKKYLADISSYNLDSPPTKAFKDDKVNVYIDVANDLSSLDINSAGKLNVQSTTFDGDNLINIYEDCSKTGRAVQRKIELEKQGNIVKTPFTSNLYKKV